MTKYINLHKNYTSNRGNYQLTLPLNIEYMIPNNISVCLLSQFVEEMYLTDLYLIYSQLRENQATPPQMLKIVLYSYMNHIYSSRDIKTSYSLFYIMALTPSSAKICFLTTDNPF